MLELKSNFATNIQKQKVQNLKFFANHIHFFYYFHFTWDSAMNQRPEYKFLPYSNFYNMISLGTINVTTDNHFWIFLLC